MQVPEEDLELEGRIQEPEDHNQGRGDQVDQGLEDQVDHTQGQEDRVDRIQGLDDLMDWTSELLDLHAVLDFHHHLLRSGSAAVVVAGNFH